MMAIDSAEQARLAFEESDFWKNLFAQDPTKTNTTATQEAGLWKIEIDSANYSTVLWMSRAGKIELAQTTVTDKYGEERQFLGLPTTEVVLGQVTVF